jgi:hypothetical protein
METKIGGSEVNVRNLLRAALIVAAALVPMAIAGSASAAEGRFACRASAARVVLLGVTIEPVVANAGSDPCQTQTSTRGQPETSGLVTVGAADAATIGDGQGSSTARVADVGVNLSPGLLPLDITISGLNATSSYTCDPQLGAVYAGSSQVAGVKIAGLQINLPDANAPVDIDLGDLLTLHLNQTLVSGSGDLITVTRRAAFLESKALGIELSLAEATAGTAGTPCAAGAGAGPPTPQGVIQKIFVPITGPTAGITSSINPGACATKPFTVGIKGTGVKSTTFTVDGKTVAKLGRNNNPKVTINPAKIAFGTHKVRAVVTFVAKTVRPKTLNLIFNRCGAVIPTNAQFGKCIQLRLTNVKPGKVFVALFSGPDSIRNYGGHVYTFTSPGTRVVCLKVPLRSRAFKPGTTRTFTVAVKFPNGTNFVRRIRIS